MSDERGKVRPLLHIPRLPSDPLPFSLSFSFSLCLKGTLKNLGFGELELSRNESPFVLGFEVVRVRARARALARVHVFAPLRASNGQTAGHKTFPVRGRLRLVLFRTVYNAAHGCATDATVAAVATWEKEK